MTRPVKTAAVQLTQEEANLVLRAVEELGAACAAAVETEHVEIIDRIWNKVFDAGLEQGFGALPSGQTATQEINVFDLPAEDDVTGYPV